jgi:hypothetical protein
MVSVAPGTCRTGTSKYVMSVYSHIIFNALFTDHSNIRRYVIRVTDSVVK